MLSNEVYGCHMGRWARSATVNLTEAGWAFLASAGFFSLAALAIPVRGALVLIVPLAAAYVCFAVVAAKRLGPLYGVPLAIAAGLALDSFYIPPTREFGAADWQNWLVIAIYLVLGVLIGMLGARSVRRAESSEQAGGTLADEQAAQRRVATLIAGGAPPPDVFAAVAEELGRLLRVHATQILRFDPEGNPTSVGSWSTDSRHVVSAGTHDNLDPTSLMGLVFKTGRPARIESYDHASDQVSAMAERLRIGAAVGAPIFVEGQLWGVMTATSDAPEPLAPETESRIAGFTDLVATAISSTEARAEVGRLADEQAALRRVATLVAREAPPEEVFAKVAEEVVLLLDAESAWMCCYQPDGTTTIAASRGKLATGFPVGMRVSLEGDTVAGAVLRTGRPARIDDYAEATGSMATYARDLGIRSAVASPIVVDGRLWGAMAAASRQSGLPAGSESRIAEFTELVATAISNMQARSDLAASRARIVAATDDERRRVVRDLHDGAQQRLVHTVVTLKLARRALEDEGDGAPALVTEALENAEEATRELRELAHGILPSVLTRGGLRAGVAALASRTPVPVDVHVLVNRLPPAVEATAYFVVAEALTNVAKHARAHRAAVMACVEHDTLQVEIQDDGVGGAEGAGSGLLGLGDRLAVLDGTLRIQSPPDGGTLVAAAIPVGR
jgi:signal transduction histidine kinase